MIGIILAGGLSTRLKPYDDNIIPKTILPVGLDNKGQFVPAIRRLILQMVDAVDGIYVVCNSKNREKIIAMTGDIDHVYYVFQMYPEQGGALASVSIWDDSIVVDGDNYYSSPGAIYNFVRDYYDGIRVGYVTLKEGQKSTSYAMMSVDVRGKILDIEEKPAKWPGLTAKSGLLLLPKGFNPLGYKSTTELIKKNIEDCEAVQVIGDMIDIGTWDSYIDLLRSALA